MKITQITLLAFLCVGGLSTQAYCLSQAAVDSANEMEANRQKAIAEAATNATLDAILSKNNVPSSDVARQAVKEVQQFSDRPVDEANIRAVMSLLEEKKPVTKDAMDFRAAKVVLKSDVFPMACGNPDKTKDLKAYAGSIERAPTGGYRLAVPDPKADGGVRYYMLADNVGLISSSIPDPVISITSKDKFSEGYVNDAGNVQCVSAEIDASKFSEMNAQKRYANPVMAN